MDGLRASVELMTPARLRAAVLSGALVALLVGGIAVTERPFLDRSASFGGVSHAGALNSDLPRQVVAMVAESPRWPAITEGRRSAFAPLLAIWGLAWPGAALICRRSRLFTLVDTSSSRMLRTAGSAAGPRAPPALLV